MRQRHWGPGPVFVFESIIAARRWQYYALRSLFVIGLLIALWSVWQSLGVGNNDLLSGYERRQLTRIGQQFFAAMAGLQLAVILLAAPAATAGAICLDRTRGTLSHVFATDLEDTEIVGGKLAARLAPIFALVATALPVLALASLLGGIIPEAAWTLFLISLALAVLGCSLALLVSSRMTKTHEVLMVVYAIFLIWLLSLPIWMMAARKLNGTSPPDWFFKLNPFVVVYAPYETPGWLNVIDVAVFLAGALVISAILIAAAVWTLRWEITPRKTRSEYWQRAAGVLRSHLFSWWPSPSLDGNPVLWREWHRNRPSKTARRIWMLFAVVAAFTSGWGLYETITEGVRGGPNLLLLSSCLQVAIGLLFLSVLAPNALAEERVRGSLDVLMATPLPTAAIVMGKWWGTFRIVPWLAILPGLGAILVAVEVPETTGLRGMAMPPHPINVVDRLMAGSLPVLWVLTHGAAITSSGLLLATWFSRPSRAIAGNVAFFLLVTFGSLFFVAMILDPWLRNALTPYGGGYSDIQWIIQGSISISPLAGQIVGLEAVAHPWMDHRESMWALQWALLLTELMFALGTLAVTMAVFDGCIGRVDDYSTIAFQPTPVARRDASLEPERDMAPVGS